MAVLFHADICDREFGSHLLSVAKLNAWTQSLGLELVTSPPVDSFKFVQAEALLCAIERAVTDGTSEHDAATVIQLTPALAQDRAAEIAPRWLLGADAHQKWRGLILQAVKDGELVLLNYGSKLPIAAPTTIKAPPAVTVAEPIPQAVETPEGRQAARYKACIDRGLIFSSNPMHPMPRGVGVVATLLGIKRQSLTADLVKHIERLKNKSS